MEMVEAKVKAMNENNPLYNSFELYHFTVIQSINGTYKEISHGLNHNAYDYPQHELYFLGLPVIPNSGVGSAYTNLFNNQTGDGTGESTIYAG